jgi:phosphoribosylformylglycinamidine cyclo-ligase
VAITYKDAGVDINKKSAALRKAGELIRSTHNASVLADIGHFGGLFSGRFDGYQEPVLVSSTDGVGTKVEVAAAMNDFSTVGQDIVHHCVNDILCTGAKPLFFLDYIGTSKLEPAHFHQIIQGLAAACKAHDCPLVSGETAEMPGVYHERCVDLVGTIIGLVERSEILDGSRIRKGDVLLGLRSDGLHTNGYSLARRVLLKGRSVHDTLEGLQFPLGKELLRIHRSYYRIIYPLLSDPAIHAVAHVTGGGIIDNVERLIPPGLTFEVDWDAWERPQLFRLIQKLGPVPEDDMRQTFNLGVGFVVITGADQVEAVRSKLSDAGEETTAIGRIVSAR